MHAERLLLLIDELDELGVALREACTFGGLCTLLVVLAAAATALHTASLSLGVCAFIAGMGSLALFSALRRPLKLALLASD